MYSTKFINKTNTCMKTKEKILKWERGAGLSDTNNYQKVCVIMVGCTVYIPDQLQ